MIDEKPPPWHCSDCAPEIERLRAAFADAIKGMELMLPYVNDYARERHGIDVHVWRAQLAAHHGKPDTEDNVAYREYLEHHLAYAQRRSP